MIKILAKKKSLINLDLSVENIDKAAFELPKLLETFKLDKKVITSLRITVESFLLDYFEALEDKSVFTIHCYKSFGNLHLTVEISGPNIDLINKETDEDNNYMDFIFSNFQICPTHSYKNNANIIDVIIPTKKINPIIFTIVSILLSVATYKISGLFTEESQEFIKEVIFVPTQNSVMSLLKMAALFEIFFSLMASICNMRNRSVFNKYKSVVIDHLILENVLVCILATTGFSLFFKLLEYKVNADLSVFGDIYSTLLKIIPSNIVEPFATENASQVMFLGIVIGYIILGLEKYMSETIKIINQINKFVITSIYEICRFMPLIIYINFTCLLFEGSFSSFDQPLHFFIFLILAWLIVGFVTLFIFSVKCKTSPIKYLHKVLPAAITGFTTASSLTCIPQLEEICEEYGISEHTITFTIPMIHLFYKIDCVLIYSIDLLTMFLIMNQTITIGPLIALIFIIILFSIATPPVQGGTPAIIALLIAQAGLPEEAITVLLAILPLQEMISKTFEVTFSGCEIIMMGKKLK